jgi:hypothetical protein
MSNLFNELKRRNVFFAPLILAGRTPYWPE